jgi:hypothetical protein
MEVDLEPSKAAKTAHKPNACAPLILSPNQWLRLLLGKYITQTLASILYERVSAAATESGKSRTHTPQCEKRGRRRRRKICPDLVAVNRSSSSW